MPERGAAPATAASEKETKETQKREKAPCEERRVPSRSLSLSRAIPLAVLLSHDSRYDPAVFVENAAEYFDTVARGEGRGLVVPAPEHRGDSYLLRLARECGLPHVRMAEAERALCYFGDVPFGNAICSKARETSDAEREETRFVCLHLPMTRTLLLQTRAPRA